MLDFSFEAQEEEREKKKREEREAFQKGKEQEKKWNLSEPNRKGQLGR